MRNLHQLFVLCTASQIIGGDFAKSCGLLRIYELKQNYQKSHQRLQISVFKVTFQCQKSFFSSITFDFETTYFTFKIYFQFFVSSFLLLVRDVKKRCTFDQWSKLYFSLNVRPETQILKKNFNANNLH